MKFLQCETSNGDFERWGIHRTKAQNRDFYIACAINNLEKLLTYNWNMSLLFLEEITWGESMG